MIDLLNYFTGRKFKTDSNHNMIFQDFFMIF